MKRYFATLVVCYLCLWCAFAAAESVTLSVANGSITIDNDGYTQANGAKVNYSGDYVITGASSGDWPGVLTVSSGKHNITFDNLSIDATTYDAAVSLYNQSEVNLTLKGENTLIGAEYSAGLFVAGDAILTIDGNGSLDTTGGKYGAGIGGAYYSSSGTIIINDGIIKASGGSGSGIGNGSYGEFSGPITINGGTIHAVSTNGGAGIGGRNYSEENGYGNTGVITINGGTISAVSMGGGAGIGGSNGSFCKSITISGGNIEATSKSSGAGIGGGQSSSNGGIINILGGTIVAISEWNGAGIGGGCANITGDVTRNSFGMFSGKEAKVTMRFSHRFANAVVDRFGKDVFMRRVDDNWVEVVAPVVVSPMFFRWLYGLGAEAYIVGPQDVREAMKNHLLEVSKLYE